MLMGSTGMIAQVGIGTNQPNSKSLLDIQSKQTGLLIPRMKTVERNAIALKTEHEGMLVYDTDLNGFYYVKNNRWTMVNTDSIPSFYINTGFFKHQEGDNNNAGVLIPSTEWLSFLTGTYTPKSNTATGTIFFECSSSLETYGSGSLVDVEFVINNTTIRAFKYGGASSTSEDQGSINLLVPFNNPSSNTSLNFEIKLKRSTGTRAKVNRVDCTVYEKVNI